HVQVAEPAPVGKHRQGISLEGAGRKNVKLHEGKTAKLRFHGDLIVVWVGHSCPTPLTLDFDGQNKSHQIPNQYRLQKRKTGVSAPRCQLQSGVSHPVSPKDGETRVGHPRRTRVSDPHYPT